LFDSEAELLIQPSEFEKRLFAILDSSHLKTTANLKLVEECFNKFDFVRKEQQQREQEKKESKLKVRERTINMPPEEIKARNYQKPEKSTVELGKDSKQLLQMCKVMKYQTVERHTLVFDYHTSGDLFFMLLRGRVHCKVPFSRQFIQLSETELTLFKEEFRDDLMEIEAATTINLILSAVKGTKLNPTMI
jgi:hypothetical protein